LQRFGLLLIEHRYRPNGSSMTNRYSLTETKKGIGTRHGIVVVRMAVDPANPQDFQQIHALQDALTASQQNPGTFWGGLPEKDALCLPVTPARNDGVTIHKLTIKDVPVDDFWLISVYNPEGYLEPNQYTACAENNITAKKDTDDTVAIQFGGCDGEIPNCLPIMKDWNYTVRLFRPRPELLNGAWRFPEAQPVS
jgi:hypothetical protein